MYLLLAILGGVSIVVARTINSKLASEIGILQGTFFNYVGGLIFSALVLVISGNLFNISVTGLKEVPTWAYFGGIIGVLVVTLSSFVVPKISAFYLTILIFVGQLFTGIIFDYFKDGHLSMGKVIGGVVVTFGLLYSLMGTETSTDVANKL